MNEQNNKQSFIHKTYQRIFLIYAPVALVSIIVKTFSDIYLSYFFLTILLVAALSIVIGIIMCVQFVIHRDAIRKDKEINIPYIVRHKFMIMYIPIAIGSMLISSYYIFDKYVKTVEFYGSGKYKEISILFPIHDSLGEEMEGAEQASQALGELYFKYPELVNDYHISIYDHKNTYDESLEEYVFTQMERGTNYFICAYGDVCAELAENFEVLQKKAGKEGESIIVTTLSSSMELPLKKDYCYRFYVRNKEEAGALSLFAFNKMLKTASFIASDDLYGHDAVAQFKECWEDFGGKLIPGIYIDPSMEVSLATSKLKEMPISKEKPQAIFVAHYNNINPMIEKIGPNKLFLFSSNYKQQNLQNLVEKGFNRKSFIVVMPTYKLANKSLLNTSGVFLYITLEKLITADQNAEGDLDRFHHYWQQEDVPSFLKFKMDGEADFKVSVDAMPYKEDPHNQASK